MARVPWSVEARDLNTGFATRHCPLRLPARPVHTIPSDVVTGKQQPRTSRNGQRLTVCCAVHVPRCAFFDSVTGGGNVSSSIGRVVRYHASLGMIGDIAIDTYATLNDEDSRSSRCHRQSRLFVRRCFAPTTKGLFAKVGGS